MFDLRGNNCSLPLLSLKLRNHDFWSTCACSIETGDCYNSLKNIVVLVIQQAANRSLLPTTTYDYFESVKWVIMG